MKNKLLLLLSISLLLITTACGSGSESQKPSRYEEILKCEGRYVQRDEDSKDTYGAEVSFYEKEDKVYANIDYSGYMGTLKDAEVEDCSEDDYLYEMHPVGKLAGMDQDFLIRFNEEKMYISWGETCEYTLTKSDGSPEDEVDQRTPFDEEEMYQTIVEKVDDAYTSFEHKCSFDRETKTLWICVKAPEGLRTKMASYHDQLKDSWDNVVETSKTMGETLKEAVRVGYTYEDVSAINFYMVDELKEDNNYDKSEILLAIVDGVVIYNIADDFNSSSGSGSSSNNTSGTSDSSGSSYKSGGSSGSNSYDTSSATAGERNALEKAHQYLDYTSFSYSGLIDQLKYEGYSDSEATYAADHCGADWYEQAVKKAQDYLDYTSFSREGLQDQLEYEGFTSDQAAYGVEQTYH